MNVPQAAICPQSASGSAHSKHSAGLVQFEHLEEESKCVARQLLLRRPPPNLEAAKTFDLTGKTGSFMFMAPEVYRSQNYNEKADVFSFACIMYEVFARFIVSTSVVGPTGDPETARIYAHKVRPQPPVSPDCAVSGNRIRSYRCTGLCLARGRVTVVLTVSWPPTVAQQLLSDLLSAANLGAVASHICSS